MFVKLNDELHSLRFRHGKTEDGRDFTTAQLSIYDQDDPKASTPVAIGTVYRHFRDQPCRETARKAALAKALETNTPEFRKEQRRDIWNAYLNRKRQATGAV